MTIIGADLGHPRHHVEVAEVDPTELDDLMKFVTAVARQTITPSAGHEADDVAQDVLRDYLRYSESHEVENPKALLRVMTKRRSWKYRDVWEGRRPWLAIFERDEEESIDAARLGGADEAAVVGRRADPIERRDNADAIRWAIGGLQGGYREVAELTYLAEPPLNAKEIAARLDLAHGTVRNRQVAVRRALADLLADS